jgi:hypothetical protein
VSDIQNQKSGGKVSWQVVIDAVVVLSAWVDVMYAAAGVLSSIVRKRRMVRADVSRIAVVVDEIVQGLGRPSEAVDTLKNLGAKDLYAKWNGVISIWRALTSRIPEKKRKN